jgi:hypothetical protein
VTATDDITPKTLTTARDRLRSQVEDLITRRLCARLKTVTHPHKIHIACVDNCLRDSAHHSESSPCGCSCNISTAQHRFAAEEVWAVLAPLLARLLFEGSPPLCPSIRRSCQQWPSASGNQAVNEALHGHGCSVFGNGDSEGTNSRISRYPRARAAGWYCPSTSSQSEGSWALIPISF